MDRQDGQDNFLDLRILFNVYLVLIEFQQTRF